VFLLGALGIVGVLPALATPIGELNDLARYFPADTPIFAAVRTDDAFFSELDGIVAKVADALPPGIIPPVTIVEALDMALADAEPPMSFQEDIRPWLGDTMAFGVLEIPNEEGAARMLRRRPTFDGEAPVLVAVAITDRAAVTDFFVDGMTEADVEFERTDEADFTLITPTNTSVEFAKETPIIVIRDDALFVTNQSDSATTLPDGSLASSAEFNETFALLPGDDYNISVFMDFGAFIEQGIANTSDPDTQEFMGLFGNMFSAIGPQAWGATLLDGVNLTLDAAQRITDPTAFETLGFPITNMTAIDPAFAVHIPAGATLSIHSTDLNRGFGSMFNFFDTMIGNMREMGLGDSDELDEAAEGIAQIENSFTTFTGLDLRDDVLAWMTGNYALFIMPSPDLDVSSRFSIFQTFPVDFGLAIEVTDPAAAAKTVEGLTEGVERLAALATEQEDAQAEIEIGSDTIVGTDVTVISITGEDSPWPVELLMGANDEVFALGTRNAVQSILARDGGLPSNAAYTRAQDYVLENAYSLGYFGPQSLLPLTDLITTFAEEDDEEAEQNAETARNLLRLIQSASASQSIDSDGNAISRLVLTLSE
jgi:hypothetical protein